MVSLIARQKTVISIGISDALMRGMTILIIATIWMGLGGVTLLALAAAARQVRHQKTAPVMHTFRPTHRPSSPIQLPELSFDTAFFTK
jgi:hypothetical protein